MFLIHKVLQQVDSLTETELEVLDGLRMSACKVQPIMILHIHPFSKASPELLPFCIITSYKIERGLFVGR